MVNRKMVLCFVLVLACIVATYQLAAAASTNKANMFVNPLTVMDSTNKFLVGTGVGEAQGQTADETLESLGVSNPDYTYETFQDPPSIALAVPSSLTISAGATNTMAFPNNTFEWNVKVQDAAGWVPSLVQDTAGAVSTGYSSTGLDIDAGATNTYAIEITQGANMNARPLFIIGTSPAFYFKATIYFDDVSGVGLGGIGFRNIIAGAGETIGYTTTHANYYDYAWLGCDNGDIITLTEKNQAGATSTDTTDNWGDGDTAKTLEVYVSSAGAVTYKIDGVAPTTTVAFSFDTGDYVIPYLIMVQDSDVCDNAILEDWEVGYQ